MKAKELKAKTFVLTITGDVSAGRLEDALYVGLERNEETWRKFSITEHVPKAIEIDGEDHIIVGRC
ncbi:hypothetical protein P4305_18620 [Bacillus thuringiensis]|nr:hypothetical protein [Bacillus thuringiensis]